MSRSGSVSTSLRLDDELLAQVDVSAAAHGMTRSAWLRKLIVDGQAAANSVAVYDAPAPALHLPANQPVYPVAPLRADNKPIGDVRCGHRRWWRVGGVCVRCWES